jgi:hypothetical protein
MAELAEQEGIASSYLIRVLRLLLLALNVVEAITDEGHGAGGDAAADTRVVSS